ncbi:MAG TPA: iron-containing redox enzyme family protein [Polyangiales bacterium]|nr:iron-containing redox enzyme family protein [Polyangiales bacterium]
MSDFNRTRLEPCLAVERENEGIELKLAVESVMRELEGGFVEHKRASVRARAALVPRTPDEFVAWFEALEINGPGQHDRLFTYLANGASRAEMIWFLRQELAGEAGFDDLVALTQVKLPLRPKLELARNYWDELGRGHESGVHGELLTSLAAELAIESSDDVVWESLALGNLMVALASNRHYAYQSLGALGAIELTAPGRSTLVNQGLKRLGVSGAARRYFALHATLDVKHSLAWNREVIAPLVAKDPRIAQAMAEGALMRLQAGARCFERYRRELGLDAGRTSGPSPAAA